MTLVLVRILERQTGPNPCSRDVLKLGKKADWTKPNRFGLVPLKLLDCYFIGRQNRTIRLVLGSKAKKPNWTECF